MKAKKSISIAVCVLVGASLAAIGQVGGPGPVKKICTADCGGCPSMPQHECELDQTCCMFVLCATCQIIFDCCDEGDECVTGFDWEGNPVAECIGLE